ncbi:MAG TPA: hypothetical protein VN752_08520, partial [Solirubrobacterales bacterium]|nr:hypothetical protein [Solirubrobacterales bacterium]
MPSVPKRRRLHSGGAIALTLLLSSCLASTAQAAGPPIVLETWVSAVSSTSVRLEARVNPNGLFSTYHFDYITDAAYEANLAAAKDPFAGASRSPSVSDANIGSGESSVKVLQQVSVLKADTAYRYRIVAKNSSTTTGPTLELRTRILPSGVDSCPNATAREQSAARNSELPDCRSWEMVSPIDKNGGQAAAPGELFGGGVTQAASQG